MTANAPTKQTLTAKVHDSEPADLAPVVDTSLSDAAERLTQAVSAIVEDAKAAGPETETVSVYHVIDAVAETMQADLDKAVTKLTAADLGLITRRQFAAIIRDDLNENTDETWTIEQALPRVDQECEAFHEAYYGGGAEYAIETRYTTARYLAAVWKGEERRTLRRLIAQRLGLVGSAMDPVDQVANDPAAADVPASSPAVEEAGESREDRIRCLALEVGSLKALRSAARDLGVKGAGRMNKTALVAVLNN